MSSKFLTERKFNIIIPSIEINDELLNSLKKIEELKYKNFEVTLVLDYACVERVHAGYDNGIINLY